MPSGPVDLAPWTLVRRRWLGLVTRATGERPCRSAVHSLEGRCKGTPPFTPAGSLRAERSSSLRKALFSGCVSARASLFAAYAPPWEKGRWGHRRTTREPGDSYRNVRFIVAVNGGSLDGGRCKKALSLWVKSTFLHRRKAQRRGDFIRRVVGGGGAGFGRSRIGRWAGDVRTAKKGCGNVRELQSIATNGRRMRI